MINPVKPGEAGGVGPSQIRRPAVPDAESSRTPAEARPGVAADDVSLSAETRDLEERARVEAPPSGELPPDQLKVLSRRIADRHYDQPEVQNALADRLLDKMDKDQI
jgi:hypothetical protein